MGMITTKVKTTQQMFLVGIDMGTDAEPRWRDAIPPLKPDIWYAGNLLDGEVGQTQYVEYGVVEWGRYKGSELDEVPGDHRLLNVKMSKG
jgi:hypothetical protein